MKRPGHLVGDYARGLVDFEERERHGLLATLWFQIAHYALRPWPWILVALVALWRHGAPPARDRAIPLAALAGALAPNNSQ